tara:strand:+ start:93 stop:1091 length:999 start_codon:yes stop_codon:yes gene_type:complete
MANLKSLINDRLSKSFSVEETNLEDGQIFTYCSGRAYNQFATCFAWFAPAAGTAKIEIWGAGGSTGCQCCCNFSIGGQSGAYAKKEVTMAAGGFVCGNTGHPCMPNASFCYPGCSEATCVSICLGTASSCSCMCAQGGNGGLQACHTGSSLMCCLQVCCYATVANPNSIGAGCGYNCGCRNTYHVATAYGGDINCPGTYGCVGHWTCNTSSSKTYQQHSNAIPYGQFSTCLATGMAASQEGSSMGNMQSGEGLSNLMASKGSVSRSSIGSFNTHQACWNSSNYCACYETLACVPFVPPGQGSALMQGCPEVRNVGSRGGLGYVRILFKATTP